MVMVMPLVDSYCFQLTLPKTNSKFTHENQWLEDEMSFCYGLFSGVFAVSFREGRS